MISQLDNRLRIINEEQAANHRFVRRTMIALFKTVTRQAWVLRRLREVNNIEEPPSIEQLIQMYEGHIEPTPI